MIIWANRMYPRKRQLVLSRQTAPSETLPAARVVLPGSGLQETRLMQVEHNHAVYAPYTVSQVEHNREIYAPQTVAGDTVTTAEHHSAVYAPQTVTGDTVSYNSQNNAVTELRAPQRETVTVEPAGTPSVTYHTEVQVDMVNHNQIRGEQDMVRLAETLRDALYAALQSGAEGVGH